MRSGFTLLWRVRNEGFCAVRVLSFYFPGFIKTQGLYSSWHVRREAPRLRLPGRFLRLRCFFDHLNKIICNMQFGLQCCRVFSFSMHLFIAMHLILNSHSLYSCLSVFFLVNKLYYHRAYIPCPLCVPVFFHM